VLVRAWTWTEIGLAIAAALGVLLVARKVSDGGDGSLFGPSDPYGGKPVDPYAPQETNHPGACDPVAKPGVLLFRQWALSKWGERPGSPQNIVRECTEGKSEHEQGRAWDLMTTSIDHGQSIVDALNAPDPVTGEPDALARRAGLMYMIWNKHMWRSYPHGGLPSGAWDVYTGGEAASPHVDHIHFSFSKAGADGETSLYDRIRKELPSA
jgi:hypothetical protein